jgi:hypothetical protein
MKPKGTTKENEMISEEYIRAWRIGNDAGEGFAVGNEGMTCEEAAEAEGYTHLEVDCTGQVLCSDGDDLIMIRDHNGPWAVRILSDDLD